MLSAYGSRGDVEPLAAVALRLRQLGVDVRVCAPPDAELAELVSRVGAEHVPLGPPMRSVVTGPEPPSREDDRRLAAELIAARFDTLDATRDCDVVLATGYLPVGVRDVAEKLGIPYVFAGFHIGSLPSRHYAPGGLPKPGSLAPEVRNRTLWRAVGESINATYREPLNTHRAKLGLPPVENVCEYVYAGQMWLAADPALCPWKDMTDLDIVQTGAWILPDERPLPDDVAAFLDAGPPPVYVGFGSMVAYVAPQAAQIAVDAVRAHGHRVVLARGWADLSGVDGDDCLVVGEVNHQALFPRMAAVVHHGGSGTTHTATRAGVPQVVVPHIHDQQHWADRVAELGIGAAHEGPTFTVESLTAALGTALAPQTKARATAVAGWIRTDGAMVAAKLLQHTAAGSKPTP